MGRVINDMKGTKTRQPLIAEGLTNNTGRRWACPQREMGRVIGHMKTNAALMAEGLMNEEGGAEFLKVSRRTMQGWRWNNRGPRYARLATGAVRYRRTDLIVWVRRCTVGTADDRVAAS